MRPSHSDIDSIWRGAIDAANDASANGKCVNKDVFTIIGDLFPRRDPIINGVSYDSGVLDISYAIVCLNFVGCPGGRIVVHVLIDPFKSIIDTVDIAVNLFNTDHKITAKFRDTCAVLEAIANGLRGYSDCPECIIANKVSDVLSKFNISK